MSAFSIIFVQHFGEFILCNDPVTVWVLLGDHFLELDSKKQRKIDTITFQPLSLPLHIGPFAWGKRKLRD